MNIVYVAHDRNPFAEAEYKFISTLAGVTFIRTTSDASLADALRLESEVTILTSHGWVSGESDPPVWAVSAGDGTPSLRPKDILGSKGVYGARFLLVTACDSSWTRTEPRATSTALSEWQATKLGLTQAFIVQGRLTYRASRVFVAHLLNDLILRAPLRGNEDFARRIADARDKTKYSLRRDHGSARVIKVSKTSATVDR